MMRGIHEFALLGRKAGRRPRGIGHHMVLKEQRTGGIANVPQEVDYVLTVLLKKKCSQIL